MDANKKMKSIYEEAFKSWMSKNKSYGTPSKPLRTMEVTKGLSFEPWRVSLLKMIDKLSVIYAYVKDKNYVHDESLRENLIDAINYGVISIFFMDIDDEEYTYASIEEFLDDIRNAITKGLF